MQPDSSHGGPESPVSRIKYVFASVDPVNETDASGRLRLFYIIALCGIFMGSLSLSVAVFWAYIYMVEMFTLANY